MTKGISSQLLECFIAIENNLPDVEGEIGYENSPYFKESGEFNVTVLDQALRFCNLELRQQASINQDSFLSTLAILINVNNTHWFTIRRVGHQWFDLNSINRKPVLLSSKKLSGKIEDLKKSRSLFFVVEGNVQQEFNANAIDAAVKYFCNEKDEETSKRKKNVDGAAEKSQRAAYMRDYRRKQKLTNAQSVDEKVSLVDVEKESNGNVCQQATHKVNKTVAQLKKDQNKEKESRVGALPNRPHYCQSYFFPYKS